MKINALKIKLRKLHKYIGFSFSVFITYLSVTGILLLYPEQFRIKDKYISNYYILKKYNMETYKDVYELKNNNKVVFIKNNIYLNGNFIDKIKYNILGIKYDSNFKKLFVLDDSFLNIYIFENINEELEINEIILIENKFNLINIGYSEKFRKIVLKSKNIFYKLSDNNIVDYKIDKDENLGWSEIIPSNKDTAKKHLSIHQGEGVSLSRIVTELHNGKFFGSPFTFILFISSLSLIFLTLSSIIFATNIFNKKKMR